MDLSSTVTFRTLPEFKKRVDFLAKETHRTASFYYNKLLNDYLNVIEDIYLSEKALQEIREKKMKSLYGDSE